MGQKSGKNTPTVISGTLYTNDAHTGVRLADLDHWKSWIEMRQPFYYEYGNGGFSVRGQGQYQKFFWYAYKRIDGKLHKKYLGAFPKLADLEAMGQTFQALISQAK